MKKYFIALFVVLFSFSAMSQEEEQPFTTKFNNINQGSYLRDSENVQVPYIGTYIGIWSGMKITLVIEKVEHYLRVYPNGHYYYEDFLIADYKVDDLQGNYVIVDNLSNEDPYKAKLKSVSYPSGNKQSFVYLDEDFCGATADITITRNPFNTNIVTWEYKPEPVFIDENCPYYNEDDLPIPVPIPQVTITLTKVD